MHTRKIISIVLVLSMLFVLTNITSAEDSLPYATSAENFVSEPASSSDVKLAQNIELRAEEVPEIIGMETAVQRGHIKRIHEKETGLNNVIFENTNGTETFYLYDYPVKYADEQGAVHDVQLDIVENVQEPDSFITRQNSIKTRFSKDITNGIRLSDNETEITLLPEPVPETRTADAATLTDQKTVTYAYGEHTAIRCSLTYTGFQEDIMIQEYTGQTEYQFKLKTNGLRPVQKNDSYYLADNTDRIKINIGDVVIFTADERNNTFGRLSYETITENEEYLFTIRIDEEYLTNAKTAYPLAIDTVFDYEYSGAIEDVTINSTGGSGGTSGSLYVGRRENYGISRVLMKFSGLDMNFFGDHVITEATISLRDLMCESTPMTICCHPFSGNDWSENTASWSTVNPNSYSSLVTEQTVSYDIGVASNSWEVRKSSEVHRYGFVITGIVQGWKNGLFSQNKGLILKAKSDVENGSAYNAKTFASYNRNEYKPHLWIEYATLKTENIKLSAKSISFIPGATYQLHATVTPVGSNQTVTWSSNNPSVATVSSAGLVRGMGYGNARIAARTTNGIYAFCDVQVGRDTLGLINGESYYIENVFYKKYMDVTMGYDTNYTEVIGFGYNGNDNQKWKLKLCKDKTYELIAGCSPTGKTLDVTNNKLDIYTDNNAAYQQFTIERLDTVTNGKSGCYFIKFGDKYLTLSSADTQTLTLTSTADTLNGRSLWSFEKVSKGDADIYCFTTFIDRANESNYKSMINTMGYTPYYFLNYSRDTAFSYLKNDAMFFHTGHGDKGLISFSNANASYPDQEINATAINSLPYNDLAGLRCFITIGCSSGATDDDGNNIIKSIFDKGAQFSLGFTHTQYVPISDIWLMMFIDYSSQGYDIWDSMAYADKVSKLPYFGPKMKCYWGDYTQHLIR